MRRRARGVLPGERDQLAAPRGRNARALRRPPLARRAPPHRACRARWRAAPFPRRLGRHPPRRRTDRSAAGLCALRRRERPGGGVALSATRGPEGRADRGGACLGQLAHALPRCLRAHVQPVPPHERALLPRSPRRGRARRARAMGALGARHAGGDCKPSLRGPRLRVAGGIRSRAREDGESVHCDGARHARGDPVLAHRPRARRTIRSGRRRGRRALAALRLSRRCRR